MLVRAATRKKLCTCSTRCIAIISVRQVHPTCSPGRPLLWWKPRIVCRHHVLLLFLNDRTFCIVRTACCISGMFSSSVDNVLAFMRQYCMVLVLCIHARSSLRCAKRFVSPGWYNLHRALAIHGLTCFTLTRKYFSLWDYHNAFT